MADPNSTTTDILKKLTASGKPIHEWGKAVDGTPIISARTGGDRKPAIFITAGVHSTETAGVHAALNLLEILHTEHEVHILPLRDPFGFAGVNHCISVASGQVVHLSDHQSVLDFLSAHADLVWCEGQMRLFRLGDYGFVWDILRPGLESYWNIMNRMDRLASEDPELVRQFRGKSVMLINSQSDVEGAGEMQRCWHGLFSTDGRWLHLNRLFEREDAPPEVMAVDRLMKSIRPGLTCDLHEGNGHGFWMPIPRPAEHAERVFEMTRAYFDYVKSKGYPISDYDDWKSSDRTATGGPDWMVPEPRLPGLFWMDTLKRGEGHNLCTYACLFGTGYGTEAPMECPLAMRVDAITHGMLAAIKVWEAQFLTVQGKE